MVPTRHHVQRTLERIHIVGPVASRSIDAKGREFPVWRLAIRSIGKIVCLCYVGRSRLPRVRAAMRVNDRTGFKRHIKGTSSSIYNVRTVVRECPKHPLAELSLQRASKRRCDRRWNGEKARFLRPVGRGVLRGADLRAHAPWPRLRRPSARLFARRAVGETNVNLQRVAHMWRPRHKLPCANAKQAHGRAASVRSRPDRKVRRQCERHAHLPPRHDRPDPP